MSTAEEIRTELKDSTRQLLSTVQAVPEADFNRQPAKGRWSAGQIAEHLIRVEVGTLRFFTGANRAPGRDPEAKVEELRRKLLNREQKLTAYGPIVPDDRPKQKQAVLAKLQDTRQRLTGLIELEDMSRVLTDFDHPLFGPLSRAEWIWFIIFHSARHRQQLRELLPGAGD